ncbi:MAG: glycosyltransferase family 4 protein [Dehalococcoidia bacterium]|nr:glycosyltransferase family 4 protein [Dehalococcoidia bacterium]MCB9486530.1 glycosyltransferase family 4 protein [Thermoflexaceae bacterium]
MRIALVSPYDWCVKGGVNSHVAQLAGHYRKWGHDVTIFAPASWPDAISGECYPFGKPVTVPVGGSRARVSFSWMSPRARKILAEHDFDVMHAHEPLMPLVPYHMLRYTKAARVGTFHAASESRLHFYGITRPLAKRNMERLDDRIAVSPAAEHHISRFFPGEYTIIPNGIEYDHFARPADPIPEFMDGKKNILFVGRPDKRKGLPYLLKAFLQIRQVEPETRLIVVGAGDFSKYERIMSGIPDIVFRENVPYPELPRYHHSAHVYCCPNTGNESFGIVLAEAMAAGLPVVASDIPGFAAIVRDGVDGLLVRPRDEDDIAAAILRVLRSPALARDLGVAARARAIEFSWDTVAHRVFHRYEVALEVRGHPIPQRPPLQAALPGLARVGD